MGEAGSLHVHVGGGGGGDSKLEGGSIMEGISVGGGGVPISSYM